MMVGAQLCIWPKNQGLNCFSLNSCIEIRAFLKKGPCFSVCHLFNKHSRLATSQKPLGKEKYVGSQRVRGPFPPATLHPYKEAEGISQVTSKIVKKGRVMVVALIIDLLSYPIFTKQPFLGLTMHCGPSMPSKMRIWFLAENHFGTLWWWQMNKRPAMNSWLQLASFQSWCGMRYCLFGAADGELRRHRQARTLSGVWKESGEVRRAKAVSTEGR